MLCLPLPPEKAAEMGLTETISIKTMCPTVVYKADFSALLSYHPLPESLEYNHPGFLCVP